MRIQHNIPALSAYRNYTHNVSAVNKNLEKLSSGYRINRAGDDAAGLAISEKMRIQITGLEQAQSNAKSGINLVQTAEGALTEVHDMLNRMYTLAEQSANGTYSDDVDREQLQKEVVSLRTEINRIADATNYNGINLLDGSLDGSATAKTTMELATSNAVTGGQSLIADAGTVQGTNTIVHKDAVDSALTKFTLDLSNLEFDVVTDNAANTAALVFGTAATITTGKFGKDATSDDIATELVSACGGSVSLSGITYKVSVADGDKLVFEMTEESAAQITTGNAVSFKSIADNITFSTASNSAKVLNMKDFTVSDITLGQVKSGVQLADTKLSAATSFNSANLQDGTGLKVGDVTYVFAKEQATIDAFKDAGDSVKVVDLTDLCAYSTGSQKMEFDKNNAKASYMDDEIMARLTKAAADNEMWSVEYKSGDTLYFREKETYSGDADLTTEKGVQDQFTYYGSVKPGEMKTTFTEHPEKALTLQIGDTADDFNKMKVSIKDMHASAMKFTTADLGKDATDLQKTVAALGLSIDDIDISSQEGASNAMAVIKNATNYVSDVRGDLGALQNRLDHTINNLSVTQENITDAESTIRDVDIAKEMMAYTKNNILVQSAQAMLAQANQLPQGVLQLLG